MFVQNGFSSLIKAANQNLVEIVNLLLIAGGDINVKSNVSSYVIVTITMYFGESHLNLCLPFVYFPIFFLMFVRYVSMFVIFFVRMERLLCWWLQFLGRLAWFNCWSTMGPTSTTIMRSSFLSCFVCVCTGEHHDWLENILFMVNFFWLLIILGSVFFLYAEWTHRINQKRDSQSFWDCWSTVEKWSRFQLQKQKCQTVLISLSLPKILL